MTTDTPLTDAVSFMALGLNCAHLQRVVQLDFARNLELRLAAAEKDAVPVADIEAEIAHIKQNGINLARFGGQSVDEGRCRELCAMYLGEFISAWRMGQKITAIDAAMRAK